MAEIHRHSASSAVAKGMKLFLKGERCLTDKCGIDRRAYPPGEHGRGRRRKQSEYLIQLREKQKARRYYGLLEKQFRTYYEIAYAAAGHHRCEPAAPARDCGWTTSSTGWASVRSRRQARQLIRHGHFQVNGRKVDIPSYRVRPNDVITRRRDQGGRQEA